MIIPVTISTMAQYPIISLAPSPAIPRAGKAQKGWSIFVHASPHAIAMADTAGEQWESGLI